MSRRAKKREGHGNVGGRPSGAARKGSFKESGPLWDQRWILGLLLIVATTLAYQKAWHAGYIWDDDVYVTENKLLTAPDGLRRIWFSLDSPSQYFPLVYTTFRLEHALWGSIQWDIIGLISCCIPAMCYWFGAFFMSCACLVRGWPQRSLPYIRCRWNRSPGLRNARMC